jgi:MFS family permease
MMSDRSVSEAPRALVTTAVLLLSAMTVMANATIAPALPGLREHYSGVANIETLAGLIVTLPALAVVLTAGLFGWLTDKVDRQKLLLASGLLYALGGMSGLWVDSLIGMLAGRAVLGVGVAGTMVLATTWAADLWQGSARSRFLGQQGAATSAGGIAVILIGGALSTLHWRGAFGAYLLVVPVTIFALLALAPFARQRGMVPPATAIAGPLTEPFPWRVFAFVGTLGFLIMIAFYVIPTRLPFLLSGVGVTKPFVLSAVISLVTAAAVPRALAYGRIRQRMSAEAVFALSWALMGTGMFILSVAPNLPMMSLGAIVVGLGLGPAMPGVTSYLMAVVPAASRGRASGLLTTALFAGQFASPLVTAPLVETFGLPGTFLALSLSQFALASGLAILTLHEWRLARGLSSRDQDHRR